MVAPTRQRRRRAVPRFPLLGSSLPRGLAPTELGCPTIAPLESDFVSPDTTEVTRKIIQSVATKIEFESQDAILIGRAVPFEARRGNGREK